MKHSRCSIRFGFYPDQGSFLARFRVLFLPALGFFFVSFFKFDWVKDVESLVSFLKLDRVKAVESLKLQR